jgi:hypothetical protein
MLHQFHRNFPPDLAGYKHGVKCTQNNKRVHLYSLPSAVHFTQMHSLLF